MYLCVLYFIQVIFGFYQFNKKIIIEDINDLVDKLFTLILNEVFYNIFVFKLS